MKDCNRSENCSSVVKNFTTMTVSGITIGYIRTSFANFVDWDVWLSQLTLMKDHASSHTGEKPCTFDSCGKCFQVSSFLKNHFQVQHCMWGLRRIAKLLNEEVRAKAQENTPLAARNIRECRWSCRARNAFEPIDVEELVWWMDDSKISFKIKW